MVERWDLDCQLCGRNIINALFGASEDYIFKCSQEANKDSILETVYPKFEFDVNGKIINGDIPPHKSLVEEEIREYLKEHSKVKKQEFYVHITFGIEDENRIAVNIYLNQGVGVWYVIEKKLEYYEKAGIKKHEIKGSGWGRWGYAFDPACAKELNYKCDICGSPLVREDIKKT